MPLNNFEIVTALTIGSIGVIILLYFIVLKKKGWLTEEPRYTTSYLCPNPQCRKVFQEPIKMTDLSQSPPRVYLGCPHCGLDMEKIPAVTSEKSKMQDQHIPQIKPVIAETPKPEPAAENLPQAKPALPQNPPSPASLQTSLQRKPSPKPPKTSPKPLPELAPEPTFQTLPETVENTQKLEEKKGSDRPRACPHYFGYVKTLPKNTPIPDECLWCPWIVDCLAGTQKVEA